MTKIRKDGFCTDDPNSVHVNANELMRQRYGEPIRSRQIECLADATDAKLHDIERRLRELQEQLAMRDAGRKK